MRVEGVDVAPDLVAGGDFTFDGDGGGGVDAATTAQGDDVLEGGVLAEVFEQLDQGLVLDGLVALADDT